MKTIAWGVVVLAAIAPSGVSAEPAANDNGSYTVVIDLTNQPLPATKWVFLDESRITALCRTPTGCTMELKMGDVNSPPTGAKETVVLSTTDLGYTSTTPIDPSPPPKVDGDGRNRYLADVRRENAANKIAVCAVTDQDVDVHNPNYRDSKEGFAMEFLISGPDTGATTCALVVHAISP